MGRGERWWLEWGVAGILCGLLPGLPACAPDPVQLDVAGITAETQVVETRGTAHYPVRVKQVTRNGFLGEDITVWVYPLFPVGDLESTEIRLLVIDPNQPDELANFEERAFVARVKPGDEHVTTPAVRQAFEAKGYTFAEGWLALRVRPKQ